MITVQNIGETLESIKGRPWQALDVSVVNNHKIRLGFFKGEFGWHKHDNADEFFLVLKGKITIQLMDKNLVLNKNDYVLLPKGTAHNLLSTEHSYVLVVEPVHMSTSPAKP